MTTIKTKIKGMHCRSCEMLIEETLMDAGVDKSTINHKEGTAIIEFDENKLSTMDIKKIIQSEGYEVE